MWENSEKMMAEMAPQLGKTGVALMFSRGKDSIGAYIQLRRYLDKDKITLIYYYTVPGLRFDQESIRYYEDAFGQKIHQYPHPSVYRIIRQGSYQTYGSMANFIRMNFPAVSEERMIRIIRENLELDGMAPQCIGIRKGDTIGRSIWLKKNGGYDEKQNKLYPVYDWNNTRLYNEIKASGYKLPIDYKLFGRSFDGLQYEFVEPLKKEFPDDYEKITTLFPLLGVEAYRRERWTEK